MTKTQIEARLLLLESYKTALFNRLKPLIDQYDTLCDEQQSLTIQLQKLKMGEPSNA
jgi:hypothetical protein